MPTITTNLTNLFNEIGIIYNGYRIPPFAMNVHPEVTNIYDKAGVTVKYRKVHMTVDFFHSSEGDNNTTTDSEIEIMRDRLMTPAKGLVITGLGFGEVDIKGTSGGSEFEHGPKPLNFNWETPGGNAVAHIVWTIEFTIPACTQATKINPGTIISTNYSVQWSWDDNSGGLMTRNVSGFVEIHATREPDGRLHIGYGLTGVQEYILKQFPRIGGFDRQRNFTLTEDRKFVNFTITDTEKLTDVALPEVILDLSIDETLDSSLEEAYATWNFSYSASATVYKSKSSSYSLSHSKKLAYVSVGRIIIDRLRKHRDNLQWTNGFGFSIEPSIFIDKISLTNQILGNGFSYTVSGHLQVPSDFVISGMGFFDPPGGLTNTWAQRDSFLTQIGSEFPTVNPFPDKSEAIIDLCHQLSDSPPYLSQRSKPGITSESLLAISEKPSPEESWVKYKNDYVLEDMNETVYNVPLSDNNPREEKERKDPATQNNEKSPVANPSYNPLVPFSAEASLLDAVTAHNPVAPSYQLTMWGYAQRIAYRINSPNLLTYGGMKAVKIGRDRLANKNTEGFRARQGHTFAVYGLAWQKKYMLVPPDPEKPHSDSNPYYPINDIAITDSPKRFRKVV